MRLTKTSITLPDDLLAEARAASKNLSALVAESLREYLRQEKIKKAMESFGSWQGRDETGTDTVNRLRNEGGRDYAGRAD
ncbi:MAG: Post-segregation antitoxin CcdA [Deltaproteobacteria bacterium]|nr:Post-segregation antitoxin CcdA [Deltaproteobacteria bacterium]